MDGGFFLHEASFGMLGSGLGGLYHDVDAFDDDAVLIALHGQHAAGLAFVIAGEHAYGVALLYVQFAHNGAIDGFLR